MKSTDIVAELGREADRQFAHCPDIIPSSLLYIAAKRIEALDRLAVFLIKLSGLTQTNPKENAKFVDKVSATDGSQLKVAAEEYIHSVHQHVARIMAREVGIELPPFVEK